MATFVSLSEDEPSIELIRLLDLILNGPQDSEEKSESKKKGAKKQRHKLGPLQKLAERRKLVELLENGLFAHSEAIMKASEDDVESIFTVVFALLSTVLEASRNKSGGIEVHEELVLRISGLLSKDSSSAPALKLKLLTLLFNLLDRQWVVRYQVLLALIRFAHSTKQSSLLVGAFGELDDWISDWKLSAEQQREIFGELCGVMKEAKNSEQLDKFRYSYLCTFNDSGVNAKQLTQAAGEASEAVRTTLKHAGSIGVDFDKTLKLKAVEALAKSKVKTHKLLVALLQLFRSGSIPEYQQFAKKNQAFLTEEGFNAEEQLGLMRTLTLAELGLSHEQLSYAQVQEALGLDSDEAVEETIIEAVVSGRLTAKLDQDSRQVIVERTTRRGFSDKDWDVLGARLDARRANISAVLATLQSSTSRLAGGDL